MLNPYETSNDSIVDTPTYPLVSVRAVVFVLGMTVGGAILGAAAGVLLAAVAPDYYQAVFGGAAVNPFQVGLGLGFTQGSGAGFFGSLALIAITYFLKYKRQFPSTNTPRES